MVITRVPGVPHGSEFEMYLTTISPKAFYTQRTPILVKIKVFEGFGVEVRVHSLSHELFTMVTIGLFTMVTIGNPIYRIVHLYDPQKTFKNLYFN